MPYIPLRQLGQLGLNTDFDPRTMPIGAWNEASNVRFEKGSITRGPRFRQNGLVSRGPAVYMQGWPVPNGAYEIFVFALDGSVIRWNAADDTGTSVGIETDLTPDGFDPFDNHEPTTVALLQDVVYVNRPDRPLFTVLKTGKKLVKAKNWPKSWRAKAVRSLNGQTVALGVSRNGRYYPAMVKASDFEAYGSSDAEWQATTTNSASENVLGELGEKLVDGCQLRNRLYLYTENETWAMTPNLSNTIYDYAAVFSDKGVISQNCIADVSNVHYVFGPNFLWTHDGVSPSMLSSGQFNDQLYRYLVRRQRHQFFVFHNRAAMEVMFCHVSTDPNCAFPVGQGNVPAGFPDYPGCNRSLTYNYFHKTAVFDDLPYLVGAADVSPFAGVRWEEMQGSWEDQTATWDDLADHTPRAPLFCSYGGNPVPRSREIQAVDDTISVDGRHITTFSGYRSFTTVTTYTTLTSIGYTVGETISLFGQSLLTVADDTTVEALIDAFMAIYGFQGYFMTVYDGDTGQVASVGNIAILRTGAPVSIGDITPIDSRLWGDGNRALNFATYQQSQGSLTTVYPASLFLANDIGVDSQTTITAITSPLRIQASLDEDAQTITLVRPPSYGGYGDVISDSFTYTITRGDRTSTANVAITVMNFQPPL